MEEEKIELGRGAGGEEALAGRYALGEQLEASKTGRLLRGRDTGGTG